MIGSPSLFLAFAAGFASFVSPCCLPLVPGYLATVSGVAPGAPRPSRLDPRVIGRSALFVASFSGVFILLGLGSTAIGSILFNDRAALERAAGIAIILMGVLFVASIFVNRLNRDFRPPGLIERAGKGGPVVAGTAKGALLLAVYSAGLAVPFLLSAVAFNAASRGFAFFKRHYVAIQLASGIVLIAMGVLVVSGQLFRLNIQAQHVLGDLGVNFFQSL